MGNDYNKKDHYKPYSYYSGYSGKKKDANGGRVNGSGGNGSGSGSGSGGSDKRGGAGGGGSSSNMRPYSSSGNSYYPSKRSSMFSKSQGYGGSSYIGSGASSNISHSNSINVGSGSGNSNSNSNSTSNSNSNSSSGPGSSNSMFSGKRKFSTYSGYDSSRSRGSVYIHESNKHKNGLSNGPIINSNSVPIGTSKANIYKDFNNSLSQQPNPGTNSEKPDLFKRHIPLDNSNSRKNFNDRKGSGFEINYEDKVPSSYSSTTKLKNDNHATDKHVPRPLTGSASLSKSEQIDKSIRPTEKNSVQNSGINRTQHFESTREPLPKDSNKVSLHKDLHKPSLQRVQSQKEASQREALQNEVSRKESSSKESFQRPPQNQPLPKETSKQIETSVPKEPASSVSKQPTSSVSKQPTSSVFKQPVNSTSKPPIGNVSKVQKELNTTSSNVSKPEKKSVLQKTLDTKPQESELTQAKSDNKNAKSKEESYQRIDAEIAKPKEEKQYKTNIETTKTKDEIDYKVGNETAKTEDDRQHKIDNDSAKAKVAKPHKTNNESARPKEVKQHKSSVESTKPKEQKQHITDIEGSKPKEEKRQANASQLSTKPDPTSLHPHKKKEILNFDTNIIDNKDSKIGSQRSSKHKPESQKSDLKRSASTSAIFKDKSRDLPASINTHKKPKLLADSSKIRDLPSTDLTTKSLTESPAGKNSELRQVGSTLNHDSAKVKSKPRSESPNVGHSGSLSRHGEKLKKSSPVVSEGNEKKKQKIKEIVKKVDLNRDSSKKHSLFKDSKPKVAPSSIKKSDLFKDKNKKSGPFKDTQKKSELFKKSFGFEKLPGLEHKKSTDKIRPTASSSSSSSSSLLSKAEKVKPPQKSDHGKSASPNHTSDSADVKGTIAKEAVKKKEEPLKVSESQKSSRTEVKKGKIRIIDDDDDDDDYGDYDDEEEEREKEQKEEKDEDEGTKAENVKVDDGNKSNDDGVSIKDENPKAAKSEVENNSNKNSNNNIKTETIEKTVDNHDSATVAEPQVENVTKNVAKEPIREEIVTATDHASSKIEPRVDNEQVLNKEDHSPLTNDDFHDEKSALTTDAKILKSSSNDKDQNSTQKAQVKDTNKVDQAQDSASPRSTIDVQRSSPLSEINFSQHDPVSDDEDTSTIFSKNKQLSPKPSKPSKPFFNDRQDQQDDDQRASDAHSNHKRVLELREYNDLDGDKSGSDARDYSSADDDNSDAETVIADYPPRSRRGRGRLVRKSDYDNGNNDGVGSSSVKRKKPSNNTKKTRVGRDASGRSKLQRACDKGKYEIAEQLIEEGADVNDTDYAGNSSLHEAALKGHYDIVKLLIKHGADVNIQSGPEDLDTPLIDAAANGHLNVVKLLLDNGANPNISNAVNENVFELLKESDEPESQELLDEILKKRKEFANVKSHSHATSEVEDNESDDSFNGNDSDFDKKNLKRTHRYNQSRNDLFWVDLTSRSGRNEVYKRAAEGDYAFVGNYLAGGGKADLDTLIIASRHGHSDIVSILLGFGAEINGVAEDGTTALMHAVGRRHLELVKLLLNSGADPFKKRKADGKNSLQICQESILADEEEIALLKERMEAPRKVKTKSPPSEPTTKRKEIKADSNEVSENKRSLTPTREEDDFHKQKKRKTSVPPSESPKRKEDEKPLRVDNHAEEKTKDSEASKASQRLDDKNSETLTDSKLSTIDLDKISKKSLEKRSQSVDRHKKASTPTDKFASKVNRDHKPSISKDVSLKTSKLFNNSKEERKPTSGDIKNISDKAEKKNAEKSELTAKEHNKKKEEYELQKAEKIKARQQAVLLRISQAEKQREEERRLQKQMEEEKRKKDQEEAEKKAMLLEQQRIEEEKQKEIILKKKIRESYPYGLQCVSFYDYDFIDSLDNESQARVQANVAKHLPLYYVTFDNTKWVIDLQVNLISSISNIYEKIPQLNGEKILVNDSQQSKLWNFFSSLMMKDFNSFSADSYRSQSSLEKRLDLYNSEGKKFQALSLHWIKLSTVQRELFAKHNFLQSNVNENNMIEMDYSFLASDSDTISSKFNTIKLVNDIKKGSASLQSDPQPAKADKLPRKFQGRYMAFSAINASKKKLW